MKESSIGIAMSGGVDSTACALILSANHRVEGFFMKLPHRRSDEQEERVRRIALQLGIALRVIDLQASFEEKVLSSFASEYFSGRTPNPCIICNRTIKFGLLQEAILAAGLDMMATGHYSRLIEDNGRHRLYRGLDLGKDQSYFLSRLSQEQLGRTLFPLGEQLKEDTYRFVAAHGFSDFHGLESQDVCFLDNREIGSFLEMRASNGECGGPIVDTSGRCLGQHRGLFRYTIGQRRGLGIAAERALYVIALDPQANTVVVGGDQELYADRAMVREWHWLGGSPPRSDISYTVRIRSTHAGAAADVHFAGEGGEIRFHQRQRAITPGQYAVVYDESELLGSAIIVGASPAL